MPPLPRALAALTAISLSASLPSISHCESPIPTTTPQTNLKPKKTNNIKVSEGLTTKKMYFYHPEEHSSAQMKKSFSRRKIATQAPPPLPSTSTRKTLVNKDEEDNENARFSLYSLPSSKTLSYDIASLLGTTLAPLEVGQYADGETSIKIEKSCRGKDSYIIASTTSNDSIIELLLTITTLRRASAKSITAVIPYYGYCRQDRKVHNERVPLASSDIARMLEVSGVDHILSMDLHSDTLRGFFGSGEGGPPGHNNPAQGGCVPVDHLRSGAVAAAYFFEELEDEFMKCAVNEEAAVMVIAPHEGQVERANHFRSRIQDLSSRSVNMAFVSKQRNNPITGSNISADNWKHSQNMANMDEESKKHYLKNVDDLGGAAEHSSKIVDGSVGAGIRNEYTPVLVGDVKGKVCIIVDDIIDTGGTMLGVIKALDEGGAKAIYAYTTHGLMSKPSFLDELQKSPIKYLLISNSVSHTAMALPEKVRLLSVAPLFAEAIARSLENRSVSAISNYEKFGVYGDKNDRGKGREEEDSRE